MSLGPDPYLQFPAIVDLNRLFRRGELAGISKEDLAASGEPMTTRELAAHVVPHGVPYALTNANHPSELGRLTGRGSL